MAPLKILSISIIPNHGSCGRKPSNNLGTVQKLCHPGRGREGVNQKMILAYGGEGECQAKADG